MPTFSNKRRQSEVFTATVNCWKLAIHFFRPDFAIQRFFISCIICLPVSSNCFYLLEISFRDTYRKVAGQWVTACLRQALLLAVISRCQAASAAEIGYRHFVGTHAYEMRPRDTTLSWSTSHIQRTSTFWYTL